MSKDESNPEAPLVPRTVSEVFVHENRLVTRLQLDHTTIDTTDIHPFWVLGRGFVEVKDIEKGDVVISANGEMHSVVDKQALIELTTVYNLEVSGNHTYFVSDNAVWVHNKAREGGGGIDPPM